MIVFFQLRLLDTFGRPVEASVAGFDFVDAAETAAADFLEDWVILKIVSFFHFDKLIPPDFDLLNFSKIFDVIDGRLFMVVLYFPVFGLVGIDGDWRTVGWSLILDSWVLL